MIDDKSLSSFYHQSDETTLDNCDREKIHLSEAIQPIGSFIAMNQGDYQIIAASENAEKFLGLETNSLFGCSLADIDSDLSEQIAMLQDDSLVLHEVLEFEWEYEGVNYDAITHAHAGNRIIEFVPNTISSAAASRKAMRSCSSACARILNAATFDEAMKIAADAARELTGFGRIKIYKFLPDWSGEVAAESCNASMTSYLGLHFPERDIPRQVRSIMAIVPYRAIGTTSDDVIPIHHASENSAPLDLSWSLLRSVSSMHTAYLRNMGVNSSFSSSLMYRGELWGLIAAHNDEPVLIPFDNWGLVQELGTMLMLRYDQHQRAEVSDMIKELRIIENNFASTLRRTGDVEKVIAKLVPVLRRFLGADGFAFQYGSNLHVSGATPPKAFIRDLIKWAIKQRENSDQYQTTQLHMEWEPAKKYMDKACGVLIQPIVVHRVCQLLWFRGPLSKNVTWAGEPVKKTDVQSADPLQILKPRNSFDRWTQEHNDQSAAWRESEMESAREIFKEFLDIIAAQLLLKEENASLRDFAATAAHDIKAPLRRIYGALDIMHEENFEGDIVRTTHAMAMNSAKRLENLTTSLLELSVISGQTINHTSVDLNALLREVVEMLSTDTSASNAKIALESLPTINADEGLLIRLFLNLVSNAIKYRDPERAPEIVVSLIESTENDVCIGVGDNGMGIDPQHAEEIFNPMVRLHNANDIEGAGLGLAICQRVLDAHEGSIQLDTDYTKGTRFLVTLPRSAM